MNQWYVIEAEVMRKMLGFSEEEALRPDKPTTKLESEWVDRHAKTYRTLSETDDAFRQHIAEGNIDAIVERLRSQD